jgi:hypothetical protein
MTCEGAMKAKLSAKVVAQLRRERTTASDRYRIGGLLKSRHKPRAITLAPVKCLMRNDDDIADAKAQKCVV